MARSERRGIDVYPKYFDIPFDPTQVMLNQLPVRDNVNHYDTFNIRQEFERALGLATAEYPLLEVRSGAAPKAIDGRARFQDPYRSNVLAVDLQSMQQISDAISATIRTSVLDADLYIITLGLIETWRDRETGHHVWSEQVGRDRARPGAFEFHRSTSRRTTTTWPGSAGRSPIGSRSGRSSSPSRRCRSVARFTDEDIVIANGYSKGQLRAVAGQIDTEFDNVIYWPSYEIAMRGRPLPRRRPPHHRGRCPVHHGQLPRHPRHRLSCGTLRATASRCGA